jgi:CDGSH-type Zn-finger protein
MENGPYHVTGSIPLKEYIIVQKGRHMEYSEGKTFPLQEEYFLCRSGQSKNAPYCDGTHVAAGFNGKEVAAKEPFLERITDTTEGETMKLLDDGRCCYARFCHRDAGTVWRLTAQDFDPEKREQALIAASECPSGRLAAYDFEDNLLEDTYEAEISIIQDPAMGVSAGIYVKGPITIEAADGTEYEVRNRITLCRCGQSKNKPFCDAYHINADYVDDK